MKQSQDVARRSELLSARSALYKILSLGFRYPSDSLFDILRSKEFAKGLRGSVRLSSGPLRNEADSLTRSLRRVVSCEKLESEYNFLFAPSDELNCPPYETEYDSSNVFSKVNQLADIMGFYKAFGLCIRTEGRERPDYVGVELEFMHFLTLKEAHARTNNMETAALVCRDAQKKFMDDHLAGWLPDFCKRVRNHSKMGFYAAVASLALSFLEFETRQLDVVLTKDTVNPPLITPPEEFVCPVDCSESVLFEDGSEAL